ncbi:MAG: hypothetical protein NWF05_02430 [Candidatus Bathyarchaeota archaeon]|nr:hypothetical protein [Candidatus Bathyarchaeota archaeon]
MEQNLTAKMEMLMTALDQVRKYKEIVASMADFAVITALSIATALAFLMLAKFGVLFGWFNPWDGIAGLLALLTVIVLVGGVVFAGFWVNRRVRHVKVGQWKPTLEEGAPGAIKLLQELNWENIFKDIRRAKMGFTIYGLTRVFISWLIIAVVLNFAAGFLSSIVHVAEINLTLTMDLLSVVIAVFINRKDLQKRYEQVGNLDALLWELRWFDNEFRRADFET